MSELDYGAAIEAEERAAELLYRALGQGIGVDPELLRALSAALEAAGQAAVRLRDADAGRVRDRVYASELDDCVAAIRRAMIPDADPDVLLAGADALEDLDRIISSLRHHDDRPELDL